MTQPARHSRMGYWGGQHEPGYSGRISVKQVRLDSGGYANRGRDYFGRGETLYKVESDFGDVAFNIRAGSRACAITEVRAMYPTAKLPKGAGVCKTRRSKKKARR